MRVLENIFIFVVTGFLSYHLFDVHRRVVNINEKIDSINLELTYIFQDFYNTESEHEKN